MNNNDTAIARWITWSNLRSEESDLTGTDTPIDTSYILNTRLILEATLPSSIDFPITLRVIRCYVDDELNTFDLHIWTDSGNNIKHISTDVDTNFYSIYDADKD